MMDNKSLLLKEKELLSGSPIYIDVPEKESEEEYDVIELDDIRLSYNDEAEEYLWLCEIFGEEVFELDKENKTIKLCETFKAENEYKLCLIAIEAKPVSEKKRKKISDLFEKITAEAIKQYLGEKSEAKLIDLQTKSSWKVIKSIFEDDLKEEINTKSIDTSNLRTDIIAWKKIDERVGKIILLIECKSGKNWEEGKSVNIRSWKEYVGNFANEPISVFAITDLLDDGELLKHGKEKGLILDRARLIRLLASQENDTLEEIREKISAMELSL